MYKIGDKVYIVSNGHRILGGIVKSYNNNFFTLYLEDGSSTRLRCSKVFNTIEDAEKIMNKQVLISTKPKYTPYDFM